VPVRGDGPPDGGAPNRGAAERPTLAVAHSDTFPFPAPPVERAGLRQRETRLRYVRARDRKFCPCMRYMRMCNKLLLCLFVHNIWSKRLDHSLERSSLNFICMTRNSRGVSRRVEILNRLRILTILGENMVVLLRGKHLSFAHIPVSFTP
jgi:hypothetical protein